LGSKEEYSEAAKMKILKTIAVGIFTATIMLQINGCSTHNDTIQIGVLLPLTGSQASFGEWKKNGYEMVKDKNNHSGGISGIRLEFIYYDMGKPDFGRAGAEKLININKFPLITGDIARQLHFLHALLLNKIKFLFS
jgi:branched-chain amino acid transport system substrate-binding protein